MRRFFAAVLAAIMLAAVCLPLTGCDSPKVRVESVMSITNEFKGSRTVTVVYPLNADIDAIKDEILAENPVVNVEGAKFSYVGATENGYSFELQLRFENQATYEKQIAAVIGRDAASVLACKDTVMFSGTRMAEDFDVSELIGWIVRDTKSSSATKDYTFEYPVNKVTIGSDTYDTGTTVSVNQGKGIQVNSVDVKTYNEKVSLLSRTFDRSFVFSIPTEIYSQNKTKINSYYSKLVGDAAQISDMHEGNSVLYTLTFEGLNLSELEVTTGTVLDSDGVSIYYGDKDNMSTPLYEGRVFEEKLDTLSFDSPSGDPPMLKYTYSLSANAVQGEGAIYKEGGWQDAGSWDDGAFRLEDESGLTRLRIYDGRQYAISGVSFATESLGDGKFSRVTSFLYPVKNGFEGPVYAAKFFAGKGAEAKADNDGETNIVLSVTLEGSLEEINASLENIYGKGNYISYERKDGSLSDKTTLIDYIDLRQMLTLENAEVDMTYTASAENGENIVTVTNGDTETAYQDKDSSSIKIKGCVATVGYHGVIPKAVSIIFYILFGVVLFGVTTLLAYRMLVPPIQRERGIRKRDRHEDNRSADTNPEQEQAKPAEAPSFAPSQTTTFSIFELGILSRNKKYVDEINKDVEKRLNDDRLQERKKELRRRELEEMERKVYGSQKPAEETEDDTPRTQEILDTFDRAMKNEPETSAPTDPMELIDLMNEDDEDD